MNNLCLVSEPVLKTSFLKFCLVVVSWHTKLFLQYIISLFFSTYLITNTRMAPMRNLPSSINFGSVQKSHKLLKSPKKWSTSGEIYLLLHWPSATFRKNNILYQVLHQQKLEKQKSVKVAVWDCYEWGWASKFCQFWEWTSRLATQT